MLITLDPIGYVKNSRSEIEDDDWGDVVSEIVIEGAMGADALAGIEEFSHVEVVFYFDRVPDKKIETGARRPRNNPGWPEVGIFAQRGKNRPNRLGLTTARVIERRGNVLVVAGLDAIDGTPVLDIKPYLPHYDSVPDAKVPEWMAKAQAWRKGK